MSGRSFVDTNVLVYLVGDEPTKKHIAEERLAATPLTEILVISSQILGEFINVCQRRRLLHAREIDDALGAFLQAFEVVLVEPSTFHHALRVQERYGFSWWDSLMAASALEAGCTMLYTEDLHDGQVLEGSLRIVNPFAAASQA